jgi:glycerol-3-phosphate acyltransferase PlsY
LFGGGFWVKPFFYILIAYLAGSIPFGLVIGKTLGKVDVRRHGSGNVGTTNVLRTIGIGPAILVALGDVGKGFVPAYLARHHFQQPMIIAVIGFAAIAGHSWSVFLRFRGGRGVATTAGVIAGLHFWSLLAVAPIWILLIALTKYVSLASMIAVASVPIIFKLFKLPTGYVLLGLVVALIVIFRHRPNIERLRTGTEHKVGQKAVKKG